MNYAIIAGNRVVDIIVLQPENACEFLGAISIGEKQVKIGDYYENGEFIISQN